MNRIFTTIVVALFCSTAIFGQKKKSELITVRGMPPSKYRQGRQCGLMNAKCNDCKVKLQNMGVCCIKILN